MVFWKFRIKFFVVNSSAHRCQPNNIVYNVVYNVTIKGIAWVLIQYTFNVYSGLNRGFERDLQILKLMTYQGATVLLF